MSGLVRTNPLLLELSAVLGSFLFAAKLMRRTDTRACSLAAASHSIWLRKESYSIFLHKVRLHVHLYISSILRCEPVQSPRILGLMICLFDLHMYMFIVFLWGLSLVELGALQPRWPLHQEFQIYTSDTISKWNHMYGGEIRIERIPLGCFNFNCSIDPLKPISFTVCISTFFNTLASSKTGMAQILLMS